MPSPLSEKALDALAKLREHGELQRWKNGYWTYVGCVVLERVGSASYKWGGYDVPEWSVGALTINSLIRREEVVVVEKYYGRPSRVKLPQMNIDEIIWEQTRPGIMTATEKPR